MALVTDLLEALACVCVARWQTMVDLADRKWACAGGMLIMFFPVIGIICAIWIMFH